MGYNLLGERLAHPPCGTGAVLFLRFVEAMWFGASAMFLTLGAAPSFGVPVSKEIYAVVFWFFLVPVFLGYILAFAITEIEPGVKYPFVVNVIYLVAFIMGFLLCYKHDDAAALL
eukprot:CAMPEP_0185310026 /NCGR_PEP_ID=MMETSP1363-20130426/23372_1 /TAXON_ID=38817 /ORGANISM="Gephyrocapsa oceanica, Strain RCC1303" /LENGTH=114 /DNA_ID=CAMNT_0027907545 /DNA_START=141 /DNA_END=485 /DNA_ORIENTATION=+